MTKKQQGLRQIYKVIQYKDGCVYRTKPVGYAWMTLPIPYQKGDFIYASVSTSISKKIMTDRFVSEDTPDYIEVEIQ
jgi:hypothetical protein